VEFEELLAGVTGIDGVVHQLADDHVAGLRERRTGDQQEHEHQRQETERPESGDFRHVFEQKPQHAC